MSGGIAEFVAMGVGAATQILDLAERGMVGESVSCAIGATIGAIFWCRSTKTISGTDYEKGKGIQPGDPDLPKYSVRRHHQDQGNSIIAKPMDGRRYASPEELEQSELFRKMKARHNNEPGEGLDEAADILPAPERDAIKTENLDALPEVMGDGQFSGVMCEVGDLRPITGLGKAHEKFMDFKLKHKGDFVGDLLNQFSDKITTTEHRYITIKQPMTIQHADGTFRDVTMNIKLGIGHGIDEREVDGHMLNVGGKQLIDLGGGSSAGMNVTFTTPITTSNGEHIEYPVTMSSLKKLDPDLEITDAEMDDERRAIAYTNNAISASDMMDTVDSNEFYLDGQGHQHNVDEYLMTQIQSDYSSDPKLRRVAPGKKTGVNMTLDELQVLSKWMHQDGGIADSWKYSLLNKNCGNFSHEFYDFLRTSKPPKNSMWPQGFITEFNNARGNITGRAAPYSAQDLTNVMAWLHRDVINNAESALALGY
jgi:hypothetical protein